MYTEDDVKRMLAKNAGEKNFSSAKSVGYTSDDVKRMLKNVIPSQRTLKDYGGKFTAINRNYSAPTVNNVIQTSANNKATQQKINYDFLQQMSNNAPEINTQPLSSGRDYVVNPGKDASARIGAGLKSIGQTALAAVPMLGATAKQAAENAELAANSKDYAAKRAQLFMQQNGLSNTPEYENRKAQEQAAKQELNAVIENEQLNKPVAANTLGMRLMDKAKQSQMQAVEGLSPTGQFIGNTLISVGQNAALLPGAIVNPALPLAGMSAIAAADKSYELSKQGIGAGEALSRGVISGSIEAATEKTPLDNLFKIANTAGGKTAIKNILKQMGMEATEETISYIANHIADKAAADPNANFSLQDMTLSALGGALSGGIMGGGGSFYGLMRQNTVNDAQSGQNALQAEENPANSQTVGDLQEKKESAFKNYWNEIVGIMNGKPSERKIVTVGETPEILLQYGATQRPVTLNRSDVRKIAYPEGYMGGKHNLGFYALEVLPKQLENPVAILKSSTQPNSLVIFTELLDAENRPVMVPLHLDKNGRLGLTNHIASAYGRGNYENFIAKERAAGNVLYENKEKDLKWLPASGLQLSGVDATSDPINKVAQTAQTVNNSAFEDGQNIPAQKPQSLQDTLYRLGEKGDTITQPRPQLNGSRTEGDSAINHLGEREAFENVKKLLSEAMGEKKERNKGNKDKTATIASSEDLKRSKANAQDIMQAAYRKFVDSGERVSKIAKETGDGILYPLFNNAKQARQSAQYNIGKAQTDIKGAQIGKSVYEIIAPIKEKGDAYWNAFQDYLYHNHNIDSMTLQSRGAAILSSEIEKLEAQTPELVNKTFEEVQELRKNPQYREAAEEWISLVKRLYGLKNKPVFGRSVTAEKSREAVGQHLLNHPEFEELANEVTEYYRNIMDNNVAAGLISAKEREILRQLYPNYVPVMTLSSNSTLDRNNRRAAVTDVHKNRMGNNRQLLPIDEAMARKTLTAIAAQRRNIFGIRLLEQALTNRSVVGRDVQSVYDIDMPYDMDAEETPNLQNSFKVWVDGKPAEMAVSNELMEGINSIMPQQNDGNLFEQQILKPLNNAFKRGVTSANPFFTVTNILKDIQDAAFYTNQSFADFFKNYGRAYKEMTRGGKYWQLYQAMGGTGNSYFNYGEGVKLLDEYKGIIGKVKYGFEKLEALNLITEQAPRLSEFIAVMEKGGDSYENIQKALLAAADVTTNFGRSGETGKRINASYVPFFNPSVQGADKFIRNFVNKVEEKQWGKLIAQTAGAMLPALWNILWWSDDEEYDTLPDNVKDNYYLVKAGNGIWLRFPKGRAIMPATNAVERMARSLSGEEDAWDNYISSSIQAVAPNNPFTDNLAAPWIEARIWDKNDPGRTWYGGDIEPQRLQGLEPGLRYDEKTDSFSRFIGGALNISPKKINYVLDQYSGVYGDLLLPAMTPNAEGIPLLNRFYTDAVTSNRLANDFYSAQAEAEQQFKSHYDPLAQAEYEVYTKAAKTLSDYYSRERDIQASNIKDSEKSFLARELAKERNQYIMAALEKAQAARTEMERMLAQAEISGDDYAAAYQAQKSAKSRKDSKGKTIPLSEDREKIKLINQAVPHLSKAQKKKLYEAFGISKNAY